MELTKNVFRILEASLRSPPVRCLLVKVSSPVLLNLKWKAYLAVAV